jgi:hypothetical protein
VCGGGGIGLQVFEVLGASCWARTGVRAGVHWG